MVKLTPHRQAKGAEESELEGAGPGRVIWQEERPEPNHINQGPGRLDIVLEAGTP